MPIKPPNIIRTAPPYNKNLSPRPAYSHVFVHPCVINQQPHIIYPIDLKKNSPGLYKKIKHYFIRHGHVLKEDQRVGHSGPPYKGDRRKSAPLFLFTAALLFGSVTYADIENSVNNPALLQNHQIELKLFSSKGLSDEIGSKIKQPDAMQEKIPSMSGVALSVYKQLASHYNKQATDPAYITEDLRKIAIYYSEFPEVIALLKSLENKNWQLSYSAKEWVTTAIGNRFDVERAVIHFNTRAAAQLRLNDACRENPLCIASPADAMLHELLHAHNMLVKTEEFIAQGGMNAVIYPYKQEYSVIESERKLYALMSQQDSIKRPSRHDHTGRAVTARCPTCIN